MANINVTATRASVLIGSVARQARVTALRLAVLRSVKRGDTAKPSLSNTITFNEEVSGGSGRYFVDGYVSLGSSSSGQTGQNYTNPRPNLIPSAVFPVGFGTGGGIADILTRFRAAYPDGGKFYEGFALDAPGSSTGVQKVYTYMPNSTNWPMGIALYTPNWGNTAIYPLSGVWNTNSWGNSLPQRQPRPGEDPVIDANIGVAVDPPADGFQGVVRSFTAVRLLHMQENYGVGGEFVITSDNQSTVTSPVAEAVVSYGPSMFFQVRPGLGAYKVLAWNKEWKRVARSSGAPDLPPPPIPAENTTPTSWIGTTYPSPDALVEDLNGLFTFAADTNVSTDPTADMRSLFNVPERPLKFKKFSCLLGAGDTRGFIDGTYDSFADGQYMTGWSDDVDFFGNPLPTVRYSRYKTLRFVVSVVSEQVDPGGTPLPQLPQQLTSSLSTGPWRSMAFDWIPDFTTAPTTRVNGSYTLPQLWALKVDSPSTHFDDPPYSVIEVPGPGYEVVDGVPNEAFQGFLDTFGYTLETLTAALASIGFTLDEYLALVNAPSEETIGSPDVDPL